MMFAIHGSQTACYWDAGFGNQRLNGTECKRDLCSSLFKNHLEPFCSQPLKCMECHGIPSKHSHLSVKVPSPIFGRQYIDFRDSDVKMHV